MNSSEVGGEPGGQVHSKKTGAQKESKPDRPDQLMVTLEAVQSDMAALKQALDTQKATAREKPQNRRPFAGRGSRVWAACEQANQDFCEHCFRCVSSDHYARGCSRGSTGSQNQGNQRRLPSQGVAADHVKGSHGCVNCGRKGLPLKRCSSCHSVHYCSRKCQAAHWAKHKPLCSAIKYLSERL